MYISPVTSVNIYNQKRYNAVKPNFTAHPDFYKNGNSTASCYFRHGAVLLSGGGYNKIENLFAKIFKTKIPEPKKMLIIGVGNSQEPFSYTSSIKGIIGKKPLKNNLDLYTVDLQSEPPEDELKKQALPHLFEYEKLPKYAGKSFVKDSCEKWFGQEKNKHNVLDEYLYSITNPTPQKETTILRVNNEVFDFVKNTYNNPLKSKWDSRIQETILDYPDKKFDVISANNILPYIESDAEKLEVLKHIGRVLKTNGYFITDPYEFRTESIKDAGLDNFREISAGIYQKV